MFNDDFVIPWFRFQVDYINESLLCDLDDPSPIYYCIPFFNGLSVNVKRR